MKEDNPFCQACKEKYCAVGLDNTCALIRVYLKSKDNENNMKEIFVPIKGYEGLYEVSNFGRIKSLAKEWQTPAGIKKKGDTIMAGGIAHGYRSITLSKDGIKKTFTYHLLVWDHFGNKKRCGHDIVVDHKDENKLNNHINNLQVLSARDNKIKSARYIKDKYGYGTSKYVGVRKNHGKWTAQITINKKNIYLGRFKHEQDALKEYHRALSEYYASGNVTSINVHKK